ncbi:hypothetical protein [Cyanobium sp. ATX 6F1]|uniref:hypothetical protein n=1 Tax=unclassified Cyanobium TaxID=2627006 RepID=UPI0020CCF3C8|nr:hypothetical protein [Cyanobium sp. ATX 6F1]MCP9916247.1 hypothetical protein [Cyanobium sp. ATX 6F1]
MLIRYTATSNLGTIDTVDLYHQLADGVPCSPGSIRPEFVLYQDKNLKAVWAPFDHINSSARIALVGITPGWTQAQTAYSVAKQALAEGLDYSTACKQAHSQAAFVGSMRTNLVKMLDQLGVNKAFNIQTTGDILGKPDPRVHATSALRYPVFCHKSREWKNYGGHQPDALSIGFFQTMLDTLLTEELASLPAGLLIVPLGIAVERFVNYALRDRQLHATILQGFPHPSGANTGRPAQFEANREALSHAVADWKESSLMQST